jgi:hypothetical protein
VDWAGSSCFNLVIKKMAKRSKLFVSGHIIPEWGVSPRISTAVPIAASGTEVKSTRIVSESVNALLRAQVNKMKDDKEAFPEREEHHLKTVVANAKHGVSRGTFFKLTTPSKSGIGGARLVRATAKRGAVKSRSAVARKRG